MDFLDPRKKRAYKIRLMIGYALITIAIGLAVLILVYDAYGYSLNPETGSVTQNGLLFVSSQPGGANIYLDGVGHGTTSNRLELPAADYNMKLTRSGYRDWQRTVEIDPSTVEYYVYPFLFPTKPVSNSMGSYSELPPLITQTPDYHWLLVQTPSTPTSEVNFDEYDTTKPTAPSVDLSLPQDLLTDPGSPGSSISLVDWSSDNNNLLLEHTYQGGSEFIVFDRNDPSSSFNVNKMFNINPSQVALRDKSVNQLYIYDQASQSLRVGDTTKPALDPVFLKHVLAFKAYGSNLLTYVTDNNLPAGQVQARIWNNGPTYPLYNFTAGSHYLVDAAQYAGHWYYIAGSNTDDRIAIFEDPLSDTNALNSGKAVPLNTLRVQGADEVAFSTNARFVEVDSGQSFGVYDFEYTNRYQYTIKAPLAAPLHWMDGSRLIGDSNGTVFVTDYDGSNQQSLVPTAETDGGFFSADYNHLFTVEPVTGDTSVHLDNVDMRAGADLPKNVANQ